MSNAHVRCERLAWVSVVFAATPVVLAYAEQAIDKSSYEFLDDLCRIICVVVFPFSVLIVIAAISCWSRCRSFYKACIAISVLIVGACIYFLWILAKGWEGMRDF